MEKYQLLWNQTKEVLLNELKDNPQLYELFNDVNSVIRFKSGSILVLCPNENTRTKINRLFAGKIQRILESLTPETLKFKFVIKEEVIEKTPDDEIKKMPRLFKSNLNPNYTFDSFVIGDSNRLSYRYAMNVATQGALAANPLYIFGDVGLGKTHLMQAIGNSIIDQDINKKVLYIGTQQFIEEYGKACQNKTLEEFSKTYEDLDAILVDDIQMLSLGKKSQQEFFKVFNDMYNKEKLIVITSDRPAGQLKDIMDRLTSRFTWGMQVDINKPNLEHRVKILKKKLKESDEKVISDEVLNFIASNFTSNIRELEGALRRVLGYAVTFNTDVTIDVCKEALEPMLKNRKQQGDSSSYENLESVVADFYGIEVSDILGTKRNSKITLPRHICMYIMKTKYDLPYKKIGFLLGGRDHTTVISACEKIELQLKNDQELQMAINTILKKIE